MNDLDTRARRAAASLLRSVDDVDIPATPALAPRPWSRPIPLVLAAAVVVALVVAAALLVNRGPGSPDRAGVADVVAGGDVPRLVPAEVPEGLTVEAADLPLGGEVRTEPANGGVSLRVYGHPGADDPFAEADLAVIVDRNRAVLLRDENRGVGVMPVKVRGREGAVRDGGQIGLSGRLMLRWTEREGLAVYLASASLDAAGLKAVAEDLAIDSEGEVRARSLPDDLEEVGALARYANTGVATVFRPSQARGFTLVAAQDGAENGRSLSVTTWAGGDREFGAARWHVSPGARTVEVRGHQGLVSTKKQFTGASIATLVWRETPGAIASVVGIGYSEEEVLALARGLREVTGEQWRTIQTRFPPDPSPTTSPDEAARMIDGAALVVEGTFDGDGRWRLLRRADGVLCAEIKTGDGTDLSCSATSSSEFSVMTAPAKQVVGAAEDGTVPAVVAGPVPEPATTVEVVLTDGSTLSGQAVKVPGGTGRLYGLPLEPGDQIVAVVFLDDAGEEVGRATRPG